MKKPDMKEARKRKNNVDVKYTEYNKSYDMFGINFIGNEDLKRLYMPENWEGYPLKKDYRMDDKRLVWNDNIDNA